jgi:hypothetical protein
MNLDHLGAQNARTRLLVDGVSAPLAVLASGGIALAGLGWSIGEQLDKGELSALLRLNATVSALVFSAVPRRRVMIVA